MKNISTKLSEFELDKIAHSQGKCSFNILAQCSGLEQEVKIFLSTSLNEMLDGLEMKPMTFPKEKCLNLENHLLGSCFQCKQIEGFNNAVEQFNQKLSDLRK